MKQLGTGISGFFLFALSVCAAFSAKAETWIMVNTGDQSLSVIKDGRVEKTFINISIGRDGSAPLHLRGDNTTPLGSFHVAWINHQSRFKTFFGLDYPNYDQADQAFLNGEINHPTYVSILDALSHGRVPPQNTPLGGYIGIHGLGRADRKIHESTNWTEGCVALTNEQIDALEKWLRVGMHVVITDASLASALDALRSDAAY